MKKILLLYLIIYAFSLFPQNFFPSNVGNKCQIFTQRYASLPGGISYNYTSYDKFFVTERILLGEDSFYRFSDIQFDDPFPSNYYYFYDTISQKLFVKFDINDTLRLAIDFNSPKDSSFLSYLKGTAINFISGGTKTNLVLGDTVTVFSMSSMRNINGYHEFQYYDFADKIGWYKYKVYEGYQYSGTTEHTVISAFSDSVSYNPMILRIDSIGPVRNRPIDTFPFLLSIYSKISFKPFVDLFYLSFQLVRHDSLITTSQFNISPNSNSLSFYSNNLEVGDKIKLKVIISDTSIYKNYDEYPDSGWVEMTVLPSATSISDEYLSEEYNLQQNYPNPFNPNAQIKYAIPHVISTEGRNLIVELKVYDVLGNEVAILVDESKPAGNYEVEFDARNLPSGIYFYRLKAGAYVETRKMVLMR